MSEEEIKTYGTTPVHIVEEHNDALRHIHRAIGSKHLKFENNLLIHFDSHPDLLVPPELLLTELYDEETLLDKVSIESWILPLFAAGHISTLVWVKPLWSNQINEGDYTFTIGKHKETGKIRVTSSNLYFISALVYAPLDELEDTHKCNLHVINFSASEDSLRACKERMNSLIRDNGGHYILDMDLDFFSTMNPFIAMYEEVKMYERLTPLYEFVLQPVEKESPSQAQKRRQKQIELLENIFLKLEENKENDEFIVENIDEICNRISDTGLSSHLKKLVNDLVNEYGQEVDWTMIHDAGTTIDDSKAILPHNISETDDVNKVMANMARLFKFLANPVLVTVARSSVDDYCPPDQVDGIQTEFCKILKNVYDIDVQVHYEECAAT